MSKKITLELSEAEVKVIESALKYTKAYKGLDVYEKVLNTIVNQLKDGVPRYFVVQGVLDDGICRCTKAVMVKARSQKHAAAIAKAYLENDTGETFDVVAVGESTKDYGLCEVMHHG